MSLALLIANLPSLAFSVGAILCALDGSNVGGAVFLIMSLMCMHYVERQERKGRKP